MRKKKAPFRIRKSTKIKSHPNHSVVYGMPSMSDMKHMIERARAISRQLDEVKPLYQELDQITMALLNVREGLAKYGVTVVDRFAEKNTAFKTVGIKRFELEWLD